MNSRKGKKNDRPCRHHPAKRVDLIPMRVAGFLHPFAPFVGWSPKTEGFGEGEISGGEGGLKSCFYFNIVFQLFD